MKKFLILITAGLMLLVSKANAEVQYGISAGITKINASGSETEGGEKTQAEVDNIVVIPSVFAEYAYSDTISVGLDFIPLKADVSDKTHTRNDTETSVSGTVTETTTSRTNKADAELENHITLYGNYNVSDSAYIKAGVARVTINTKESLGTGSAYGNEDVYGGVIGLGLQEGNFRVEFLYTDYENVSITSSVARTGVTTNNKIEADLDTAAMRFSVLF